MMNKIHPDGEPNSDRLDRMTVVNGQQVFATGRLVRVEGNNMALIFWRSNEILPTDHLLPRSAGVLLTLSGELSIQDLQEQTGSHLSVEGVWQSGTVIVEFVREMPSHKRRQSERPEPSGPSLQAEPLVPVDSETQAVETPLFQDGTVLRRFRRMSPEGKDEIVVSATDVQRAKEALTPFYGKSLRVFQSPWEAADGARLESVIASIDANVLRGVEANTNLEGTVCHHLYLTHLDAELRETLKTFPSEMLSLEVQVLPAGV